MVYHPFSLFPPRYFCTRAEPGGLAVSPISQI